MRTSLPDPLVDSSPPSPPDSYLPDRPSDDDEDDQSDADSVEKSLSHLTGSTVLGQQQVLDQEDYEDSVEDNDPQRFSPDDEFCIINDPGMGIAVSSYKCCQPWFSLNSVM